MGMDAKGMDMACGFFRDKIYTDKVRAVVREYVCNAIDEHNKHGIDRAVDYGIRYVKNGETEFYVRDYANGLSDDGVRKIFGMYFRSTKSHSNESIGGFGVGSKAGHCYQDTFNIISHYNGVKSIYSCVLGQGDNGVPVGTIYDLHREPTSESGIEINLTVEPNDIAKFKMQMALFHRNSSSNIRAHFGKSIVERNKVLDSFEHDGVTIKALKYDDRLNEYLSFSHTNHNNVPVKMGDVMYGKSSDFDRKTLIKWDSGYVVVAECGIGMLDIPVSREGLDNSKRNDRMGEKVIKAISAFAQYKYDDLTKMKWHEVVSRIVANSNKADTNGSGFFTDPDKLEGVMVSYKALFGEWIGSCIEAMAGYSKKVKGNPEICPDTKKPYLVIIPPNNRTHDHWVKKINWYQDITNKQYFVLTFGQWCGNGKRLKNDAASIDELNEQFTTIAVKSVKYPKQKTKSGMTGRGYTVWKYGHKVDRLHDPISYHGLIIDEINSDVHGVAKLFDKKLVAAKTESGIKAQLKAIKKKAGQNANLLKCVTIAESKSTYGREWFVQAKALKDGLFKLGYLTRTDKEYQELTEKRQNKEMLEDRNDRVKSFYFDSAWVSARMKKIMCAGWVAHHSCDKKNKKVRKWIERVTKKLVELSHEDSVRGRLFFSALRSASGSRIYNARKQDCPQLTRDDIRVILKMK